MERLTKEELKAPDAFISQMSRFYEFLLANSTAIAAAGILIVLAIGAWTGYGIYSEHKEEQAQDRLFDAESKIKSVDEAFKKQTPKEADDSSPVDQKVGKLEDYKDGMVLLQGVMSNFPSAQTSVFAAFDLARIYHANQKYDEEAHVLNRGMDIAKHPTLKALVMNKLALAYQAGGNCEKAIGLWQDIEKLKSVTYLHGTALLNTGLCQEQLKQFDKAEQTYHRAELLSPPDPAVTKAAKKYLMLLKQKS